MVFVMRKLDEIPETLGEKLRALRRTQAVSLPMLEEKTRIQKKYLEALERGRYDELPEPMYTRNFLRAYARALGADEDYFLELYAEEVGQTDLLGPHRLPRMRVRKGRFLVFSRFTAALAVLLPAFLIIGYLLWQTSSLLRPPEVVISSPKDGSAVQTALLPVLGSVTTSDVTVMINGKTVVIDESLHFSTEVDLTRGLNVVTVIAKRRYSREAVIYRRVVFDPSDASVPQGITPVNFQME
ncbi:MAG TPA: helix-turn-helix domain-containing protein [bacterium]|nr:helix-turn-helix domain-containing protein [bacterium]